MTDAVDRLTAALADRYRIERELGAGGMATVYLAEDVKHRRKVAIKVLHPELSAVIGGERFLKEIELTASLQHPHILPLFDSGAADHLLYYVMPYVDGETLRGRLERERQLPVEDAVRVAREVASALDYAHKRGVVHRDVKPENVLLQDGAALVADFGIALAVSNAGAGRLTQTGLSLGTPHYMSPEQAMGERDITPRADVYALGAMAYEMLAGEPPFTGPSAQAIVAKLLTEKPVPASVRRDTVPPHVSAAIQKALAKLPADRFGTAAEFATALATPSFRDDTLAATVALPAAGAPAAARGALAGRLWIAAVAVLGLALLGALGALVRRTPPEVPVTRFAIDFLPDQAPLAEAPFALSADGSHLAYLGPSESRTQVWVKARDAWEATPLPGTDGVTSFTLSPDGKWVAFVQGALLKKLPLTGGSPVVLADSVSLAPGLAWMDDGSIVYMRNQDRGLAAVPENGGAFRVLFPRDEGGDFAFLTPLPQNRGVLFTRCPGACTTFELMVLDLRSGAIKPVQPGGLTGWYVETGHVVYIRPDGTLMAVPFDLDALEVRGAPVVVQQGVSIIDGTYPLVSLARDGTMVFRQGATGSLFGRYELVWVDRAGRETPVDPDWPFAHVFFGGNAGWALSPDGTRLAVGRNSESGDDIWVKQLPAGPALRVTFDSGAEFRPRWMPDGRSLVFGTVRESARGLYRRNADGTGADQLLLAGDIYEAAVSRDGRWLVARAGGQIGAAGARDIGILRLGTDTALTPLLATSYDESEIALSPDGRWLAYVSDETGRPEVFLRPFPEVDDAKFQVSLNGAQSPLWSRDGKELFYLGLDRALTAVAVSPRPDPRFGERRTLFKLDRDFYPPGREYYTPFDVAPDGRFLMARRCGSSSGPGRRRVDSSARLSAALADRYRLERELGQGGMATVYLAHDLKHQRDVAIKVLHPELGAALGGERFLSEIRTTARLQHPHILPLLDSGEADGLLYYVMPLVTGETLRARLQRERQLRIADAVRIATEVASALDYAHRQGVIHRDIKPENILLHEGQALVADFGIALAVQQAGGARMTQTGLSLGTPHYMSPEQAMGEKLIDARADVYALGAVLYEMLAGDPPFTGSSVQAIVARVLSEKVPPIRIVRDTVPPHVEAAVLTALAKLPADRWGSAKEFAEALAAGGGGRAATSTVAIPAAGGPRPGAARRWPVLLATLAGAAALAATWVVARRTGQAADTGGRVLRFPLEPAPGTRVAFPVSGIATFIALSPDGRQAVYAASREGTDWSLHLRRLDELHGRPLPGTDGARHPEFSPDGRWIAFGAPDGSIRKLTVQGTDLTTVTQADQGGLSGITWLTADELVFTRDSRGKPGLWRVPAAGGQPIQFSRIDTAAGEQLQLAPRAADGGRLVFYSSTRSGTLDLRVGVASTETGLAKVFPTLPGSRVLGLMSGHVVYVRSDGALMAVPFDARTWQVGEPLQILDSVTSRWWMTPAALSASGSLLYQRGGMASRIVRVDERGTARPLFEASGLYNHPRLSPDGRRLAIEVQDSRGNNIWVTDLASQATERLTREGVSERPEWSPDGRSLLYVSSRTNDNSLWLQPADGSGPAELLLESATTTTIREGVFAPDGRGVLFRQDTPDSNRDVLLLPLAGDRTPVPLLTSIDDDKHPRVSPDGRWLAYVSNRSGTEEVYVGPMSGTGARVAVSSGGGAEPLWAPDGTHLYFRTGARLVRARIATSPALAVLARDTLFEGPYITDPWHPNYDVTPDGRSFIMLQPVDENRRLVMIVNWVEELRQRTRAGQ